MDCSSLSTERLDRLAYRVGSHCAIAGNFRKSIDESKYAVTAVLSFPQVDKAGDVVHLEPDDFREHELRGGPVDLEHARTKEYGSLNIAKSVDPDGNYAVEFRVLTLDDGVTKIKLPVGTSYFDRNSRKSMQVFSMIEKGMLPAVSLEFRPTLGNKLGHSAMENRPAYEFINPQVVKYTHCAEPVCPAALLTVGKAVPVSESLDLLIPVLQTGKLGSEVLDPKLLGVLRKSVAQYTPKRVLVSGGFQVEKAMDDDYGNIYTGDAEQPETMDEAEGAGGPLTAAAAYEASQAIKDCIEQTKAKLESSEHVKGKAKILKILDKIEATAIEQLITIGDEVTAEVGGNEPMTDDEPDTDKLEEDATETDDEDDDENKLMKAFRNPKREWARALIVKSRADRSERIEPEPIPELPVFDPDLQAALEERDREAALLVRDKKRFG